MFVLDLGQNFNRLSRKYVEAAKTINKNKVCDSSLRNQTTRNKISIPKYALPFCRLASSSRSCEAYGCELLCGRPQTTDKSVLGFVSFALARMDHTTRLVGRLGKTT